MVSQRLLASGMLGLVFELPTSKHVCGDGGESKTILCTLHYIPMGFWEGFLEIG